MEIIPFKMESTEECFNFAELWICSNFYKLRPETKMTMKFNQSRMKSKVGNTVQCDILAQTKTSLADDNM